MPAPQFYEVRPGTHLLPNWPLCRGAYATLRLAWPPAPHACTGVCSMALIGGRDPPLAPICKAQVQRRDATGHHKQPSHTTALGAQLPRLVLAAGAAGRFVCLFQGAVVTKKVTEAYNTLCEAIVQLGTCLSGTAVSESIKFHHTQELSAGRA